MKHILTLIAFIASACATAQTTVSTLSGEEVKNLTPWSEALQAKADTGDKEAQWQVGMCYASGKGVPSDEAQAFAWWKKSAGQGYAEAQYWLGRIYQYDGVVDRSDEIAYEWYRKAADQGHPAAQRRVGRCFYDGKGIEQDYEEAYEWFEKAAKGNDLQAMVMMGAMWEEGLTDGLDYAQAVFWYLKAAEQDDAEGHACTKTATVCPAVSTQPLSGTGNLPPRRRTPIPPMLRPVSKSCSNKL